MDFKIWWEFPYINILLLLCSSGLVLSKENITNKCIAGLELAGYTIPQGDITIESGTDLDIECVVDKKNVTGNLWFTRGGNRLPSEMYDFVNSTFVKLHVRNPQVSSGVMYTCMLENTTVCMNVVSVGLKPQKVVDFRCISHNWENLTCTWTAPENYVKTTYKLKYTLGGSRSVRKEWECNQIRTDPRNNSIMSCFWNVSTPIPYRPVQEIYNFNLTMTNKFGTNYTTYVFKHFEHVLPGPPENLTVISTTTSSVYLFWEIPVILQDFPDGVVPRILYVRENETTWNTASLEHCNLTVRNAYCNIKNLPYAHALYDIRVSLRSRTALPTDESLWSRNASITVLTDSTIPDSPPETNVGSFEIVTYGSNLQHREAYIYWKQIPDVQKNGANFRYRITVRGNDSVKPVEIKDSYAKFNELKIFDSYIFDIASENENGTSINKTSIFLPKQADRVKDPQSFTKVEYSEGKFELTWDPPELAEGEHITNYTIFTCENTRDRPYQCTGMLNWFTVPSTNHSFTIEVKNLSQFAISANTHNSSSGMLWASCTVIHNKNMGKLKTVWINKVDATSMQVAWKLDCSDRIGSVEGYIVYYCPIKSPFAAECKGPQVNQTFESANLNTGTITDLKPYTTYMLTVAVRTKHTTFSQQSDHLFNTTLEAAPSGELKLKVVDVTNSSLTVSWTQSEPINGVLRYFEIECSNCPNENKWRVDSKLSTHEYTYTIENLDSYKNYTISVVACTVQCGNRSFAYKQTLMGYSNKIVKPTVDRRNDTSILITWNRPSKPGGNNDYYMVRLTKKYRTDNETTLHNSKARKYVINNCGDGGKYNTFYVAVKAVNLNNGTVYEGPWSDELENYCDTPVNFIMYILLIIAILSVLSTGFLFTKLYHRCKVMRDVEVKLPPGLAPVVADHTLVPWSTEKHQDNSHSPPDEELLLVKMTVEGRQYSGDSSGCSSGHESVNSSLESGTHISSSSDSGTEQPGNYGNYCSLGVNPKLDSSYIPVSADSIKLSYKGSEDSSESSPYVMTGEAVKTVNPGYVPFSNPEPIAKSSGYVVPGIKSVNGYIPFNQTDPVIRNTGYVVAGIKNCKLD